MKMTLKRYQENDWRVEQNTYLEAIQVPEKSLNYAVPSVIPPRKGKKLAIAAMSISILYGSYFLWDSYLRYDSFGVVKSDIVQISSPNEGIVKTVLVFEGSKVKEGDLIAIVESPEDQRQLNKNEDEIRMVQAELINKNEESSQKNLNRLDTVYQIESSIATTNSEIDDLKSKMGFYKKEFARLSALKAKGAAGEQETDSVQSQLKTAISQLKGRESYLIHLKNRLNVSKIKFDDGAELKPIEAKIAFLDGERKRISERIKEGFIYSGVSGTVSNVEKKPGELVNKEPIVSIVSDNKPSLVLFYDPSDKIPNVGDAVQVMVPSSRKMIYSEVESISKDVINPPDQIKIFYRANQKLIQVFLNPKSDYEFLISGSVIKRPNPTDLIKESLNLVMSAISPSFAKEESK